MTTASAPAARGTFVQLLRDPLGYCRAQASVAPVVRFRAGPQMVHLVTSAELARQVLVSEQDGFVKGGPFIEAVRIMLGNGLASSPANEHRHQRRAIQDHFSRNVIGDLYTPTIRECVEEVVASWRPAQEIDIVSNMRRLMGNIISRTFLSGESGAQTTREVTDLMPDILDGIFQRIVIRSRLVNHLPTPGNLRFNRALRRLSAAARTTVRTSSGASSERPDLIATMVAHEQEHRTGLFDENAIVDQALTFVATGVETAASTLSWALYEISANPAVEERAVADLVDGATTDENWPLARRIIAETLRKYPAAWLITRTTSREVELGGFRIPKNANVVVSPHVFHHDPDVFAEPDRFDPDRWLPDKVTPAQRRAFMPFGSGPRICIGNEFAFTEITIALGMVLRAWHLDLAPGAKVVPKPRATLPPSGLRMVVRPRTESPRHVTRWSGPGGEAR